MDQMGRLVKVRDNAEAESRVSDSRPQSLRSFSFG